MNYDRRASLSWGSLFLIALIVLGFGNLNRPAGNARIEDELDKLQRQVYQLQSVLEDQTQEIASLRSAINKQP